MMKRYLVTGSSGQLGQEFTRYGGDSTIVIDAPSESELNICSPEAITKAMGTYRPDVVINCAAYTNVEQAEKTPDVAFEVNFKAVQYLSEACQLHGALLVHYGTDYVFDGTKESLYVEEDTPNPINEYGRSKLAGEQYLLEQAPHNSLVLRSSWVFGHGPQNFFHKLRQWAQGRDVMKVVYDQIATPTYTGDLIRFTLFAVKKKLWGLYHLTNTGYASRYECARELFRSLGEGPLVLPVSSDAFPSPVKRPYFSALNNGKLIDALGETPPTWEEALSRYLRIESAE